MNGVLLSAIGNAILRGRSQNNGDKPPADGRQAALSPAQFVALMEAIKALPSSQDVEKLVGKGSENKELTAFLDEWRVNKALAYSTKGKITAWVKYISAIVAIALALVAAGYALCWISLHQAVDARIDHMLSAMPFNTQAQAYLSAHRGSVFIGPLKQTQAHGESTGVIINPGNLRLSQSWVSSDGYTVVPIQ